MLAEFLWIWIKINDFDSILIIVDTFFEFFWIFSTWRRRWRSRGCHRQPNTKARFWSKKQFEFWRENKDLEVFSDADFKFLGPESKFERNWRKRFWNFRNQNFWSWYSKSKSNFRFWGADFVFFWNPNFSKIEFSNFAILAESVSVFSSNLGTSFSFFRVVLQIFFSHLAKYPKYFPNFSSTTTPETPSMSMLEPVVYLIQNQDFVLIISILDQNLNSKSIFVGL